MVCKEELHFSLFGGGQLVGTSKCENTAQIFQANIYLIVFQKYKYVLVEIFFRLTTVPCSGVLRPGLCCGSQWKACVAGTLRFPPLSLAADSWQEWWMRERIPSLFKEPACWSSWASLVLTQIKERFKLSDYVGQPGCSHPDDLHSSSCVLCVAARI